MFHRLQSVAAATAVILVFRHDPVAGEDTVTKAPKSLAKFSALRSIVPVSQHFKEKPVLSGELLGNLIQIITSDLTVLMLLPPLEHERAPLLVLRVRLRV